MLKHENKYVKYWKWLLIPIFGVGISFAAIPEPIPIELQLKAPDFKIVDSIDYIEYKKLPDGTVQKILSKKYIYFGDEIIPPKQGEEISLRTNSAWTKTTGMGQHGRELGKRYKVGNKTFIDREIRVSAGVTFIEMTDGSWRNAEYGTTTKEAFDK